jgi:lipid-binding SYLF domain-containing protein
VASGLHNAFLMKTKLSISITTLLLISISSAFADDSVQTLVSRSQNATTTVENLAGPNAAPDAAVPLDLLKQSTCIVSIPGYKKAGLVFGASYGAGVAACRNALGLYDQPFYVTLAGGSWGLQIGVESTDLLLIMTEANARSQLTGNFGFKLSAEGSVAIGPLGRDLQAGTNDDFKEKTLSYSTTQGIFAGLTIDGSQLSWDGEAEAQVSAQPDVAASLVSFETMLNLVVITHL